MARLDGKTAIITGAGTGIGKTAAILFAREGARVVLAEISETAGIKTRDAILAESGEAYFVRTDVTEPRSVEQCVTATLEKYGQLNILYNNAGGSTLKDGPVTEVAIDEFWRCLKLDLFGTWLMCKYGMKALMNNGGGAVVNTTSMLADVGFYNKDCYIPAKGGVSALTRSLAVGYARFNIRVNAVAPGMVDTERGRSHRSTGVIPPAVVERHLLGPVNPEDVAYTALFLASDESRTLTGEIVRVDSGYTVA